MFLHSSILSLPHMTGTAPCLRHEKEKCVGGAAAVRTAGTKVMADVMSLRVATPAPTTKVTVAGPLPRHTSPQLRLNLSRPRVPLVLPQPSRLLLSCGMTLRSRETPTRTPADQVRSRCRLLLLRDGSKTAPHPYTCLRHYPTDAPLLLQLTPTHR